MSLDYCGRVAVFLQSSEFGLVNSFRLCSWKEITRDVEYSWTCFPLTLSSLSPLYELSSGKTVNLSCNVQMDAGKLKIVLEVRGIQF